jgi:hypothetical protein
MKMKLKAIFCNKHLLIFDYEIFYYIFCCIYSFEIKI